MFYIHKYEVWQDCGGPEEGGWWYECRAPVRSPEWVPVACEDEEVIFQIVRALNAAEYERRKTEEEYEFTSVLSSRSTFYTYDVTEDWMAYPSPTERPHYE